MGLLLSTPETDKKSNDGSNNTIIYGASTMQGYRDSQEDAHNCIVDYDAGASLFAVYDGHHGRAVAEYASQKLPDFIKQTQEYQAGEYEKALQRGFLSFDSTLKFGSDLVPVEPEVIETLKRIETRAKMEQDIIQYRNKKKTNLEKELEKLETKTKKGSEMKGNTFSKYLGNKKNKDEASFISSRILEVKRELNKLEKEKEVPFDEVKRKYKWVDSSKGIRDDRTFRKLKFFEEVMPGWVSGCTAVVALLKDNKIYVANAGDSRCIISKNGEVVEMSMDHTPKVETELNRIKNAGGKVERDEDMILRVEGDLNLTRALGDHRHKQAKHLPLEEQMISPLPDVKVMELDSDVEFIFLACDGIWDGMNNKQVVDFVRSRLIGQVEPISKICEDLFDHILENCKDHNEDNMTAIIVQFQNSKIFSVENKKQRIADEPLEIST